MIFADTGGIYALADRKDRHHEEAVGFIRKLPRAEVLALSIPIVGESASLIEGRLGMEAARRFWGDVTKGAFDILPVDVALLTEAFQIDQQYVDAELGLVDCTSLALCNKHKIRRVFTFDRKHFGLFKPSFCKHLELLP